MNAFMYGVFLQWKLDLRNKGVILIYYVVPLVFFAFMGGIFTSIDPTAKYTLIQSMTVFAVSMGAFLGSPIPLVEIYGSDIKKAYQVGGIPLGIAIINNIISGFIHLFIVSLIIFFVSPIIYDASVPENLLLYFTILATFIFTCLLLGTILGLLIKSMNKLTMTSQLLFLPSIMLSGVMFSTEMLPSIFITIGKFLPATWGFINMKKNSFSELELLPLIIIIIIAIIIIVISSRNLDEV